MREIAFFDPRPTFRRNHDEVQAAIKRVFESGRYILSDEVRQFEAEFAGYLGVRHALGVANGTDAIEIALRSAGIRPGDLVFAPAHTAVATVVGIIRSGATPVLCDVDETFNLDPRSLARAAARAGDPDGSSSTGVPKAVVVVHLYGRPADMTSIQKIAAEHHLLVIEDCAQAHGASLGGQRIGTFGRAATFSFYPTKNLGCAGDGGAIVTDDADLADRARLYREYGWQTRFTSELIGMNSRLDEIQAAILRCLLPSLEQSNEHRRELALRYNARLADHPRIRVPELGNAGLTHVFHQYVIRTAQRDALARRLRSAGIGSAVHYPVPIHRQPAFAETIATMGRLEMTDQVSSEVLSLPIGAHVSIDDVDYVAEVVRASVDNG